MMHQIHVEKRREREERGYPKSQLLLAGKFHLFVIYLCSKCSFMMDVYKKKAFRENIEAQGVI